MITVQLPDEPAPFRKWMETKKIGDPVGNAGNASSCPLAQYLYSLLPSSLPSLVTVTGEVYAFNGEAFDSPAWARRFVIEVDSRYEYDTRVLRDDALSILSGVLQPSGNSGELGTEKGSL